MSGSLPILALQEMDVRRMLLATTHLGSERASDQMKQYVHARRRDGVHIINLGKTWEKVLLAARAICAIDNPRDVWAISRRETGKRAALKFAKYAKSSAIADRFTPGTFTNSLQPTFREPRLIVVNDPYTDHQPIAEAACVNVPVIAFCATDSSLRHVDIAIPCNNKSTHSIGLMWWLLAREVLRMRSAASRSLEWTVMPDEFFYRDSEEIEKMELAAQVVIKEAEPQMEVVVASGAPLDWNEEVYPEEYPEIHPRPRSVTEAWSLEPSELEAHKIRASPGRLVLREATGEPPNPPPPTPYEFHAQAAYINPAGESWD